ncbi:myosin heavy chain, striated muscle-like [Acanthochromis polyacanthus]|uniref:myosin heavy chain, striated muscle-like n=1 Tax=Acanthochromis polyacanthus TaxID=80966 RepID=UPI002234A622|nr:myosin heavy chain, striated muscle-like [Acanthochromis polyacanthus]
MCLFEHSLTAMAQQKQRGSARIFKAACEAAFQSAPQKNQGTFKVSTRTDNCPKRDEAERLQDKIKQLQERNRKLQEDQIQYEKIISRLEKDNKSLSLKLNTAEQELKTKKTQVEDLERKQCFQRFSRHVEYESRLDKVKREAEKMQDKILLEAHRKIQQLTADHDQANRRVLSYTAEFDTLKNDLENSRASTRELQAALKTEKDEYIKSSQLQQVENQRLQGLVAGLSALLSAFEQEHSSEAAERQELLRDNENLTERVKLLRNDKIDLLKNQNRLQRENEQSDKKVGLLINSSQLQQEENQRLQDLVSGLSVRLSTFEQEHSREAAERLELQQDNEVLTKRVKMLKHDKINLLKNHDRLQREHEAAKESWTKRNTGCFSFLRRAEKEHAAETQKSRRHDGDATESQKSRWWRNKK